jgi:hypothetical protein
MSKPPEYVEPYRYDENPPSVLDREESKPVFGPKLTDSGLIAQVRRAYRDTEPNQDVDTDGTRHLKFHTDWHPVGEKEVKYAIGFIGPYNRFDGETVGDVVATLPGDTYVSIGREGSPVLYFWTDRPYDVVTSLNSIDVSDSSNHFVGGSPDELSVTRGAKIFPHSARYGAPDDLKGEHVWCDGPEFDDDILRFEDEPVLIRAWWD